MPPSPKDIVLFLDRGLGTTKVPEQLRKDGVEVVVHDDIFPQNTSDEAWLAVVGQNRWTFVSRDQGIESKPNEVSALIKARVHGFVVKYDKATATQLANAISLALPQMREIISRHQPPTLWRVYRDGRVASFKGYDSLVEAMLRPQQKDTKKE